jgi:hypothetical protein
MALLEVSGLSKQFGQIWAVRDLSFEVERARLSFCLDRTVRAKLRPSDASLASFSLTKVQSALTAHPSCTTL